jgi:GDSL-like lipase/acylhydrolase family protein
LSIEAEAAHGSDAAAPPASRRRIRSASPLVIVLVLLAELAVRAAAPKLRDPLLWPDWEAQNKVAAMDALGAKGGASVVFVGSSMVNAGFNPELATEMLGAKHPAFNAALNGSDLNTTDIWTRRVVVPRLHPKVVVVGFNSGELNDHWQDTSGLYSKMLQSPYGKRAAEAGGVLAKADAWLIDRSYLIRYRSVFRNPVDAVIGHDRAQDAQAVDPLGRFVALTKFQRRPYTPGLSKQLGIWDEVFRNYRPGGKQFTALNRLVKDLTSKGIRVVLVRMPVTADIVPLHPQGRADRERFTRAIAGFVAEHPVTFIDAELAIGPSPDLFVDPLHLNAQGQRRTTTFVVDALLKQPR